MRKRRWLVLLGMSLMLGTGIPAYAKTVDATVVEQSTKEEGYKEEIGETLKEGFRQNTKKDEVAPLYLEAAGVNYYSQLTKTERQVYDQLKDITVSQGKMELVWPEDLSFSADSEQEFEQKREELRNELNKTMQNVIDALSKDYPELYWLDIPASQYSWTYRRTEESGKIYYNIGSIYYDVVARYTEEEVTSLNNKLENLKFEGNNRYQVVKEIHDYLCETVVYKEEADHINEPYGALMDGVAVCEGYGEAFKWLCDRAGIPCVCVVGTASQEESVPHLWNYVQMEDGKWYAVDVTWDDVGNEPSYTYFLIGGNTVTSGKEKFSENHISVGDFSGVGYKEFIYPELSNEKYYENSELPDNSISYSIHAQNIGWMDEVSNGVKGGTTGQGRRVEAIKIHLTNQRINGGIEYASYIDGKWQNFVGNGAVSGTTGKSLRLEALKIRLTGKMDEQFDVYYRVHAQDYGWLGWTLNGAEAGTVAMNKRLEAVEIRLVQKGGEAPGSTDRPFITGTISVTYSAHVQNIGWQDWEFDGEKSGTTGKNLRMEAIKISLVNPFLDGSIEYRTHIQNTGWNSWVADGKTSGQTGKGLRMEAIEIRLTGELAEQYDVVYRAHVQNIGWQDWVSNGEKAGTSGQSLRVESVQIRLEKK